MNLVELSIPGLFVLESPVHGDDRGFFREWFKLGDFESAGVSFDAQTPSPHEPGQAPQSAGQVVQPSPTWCAGSTTRWPRRVRRRW